MNTWLNQRLKFENQQHFYRGKVRDVYTLEGGQLVMAVSDRISAFDHVLPVGIPAKGAILNRIAAHFLEATRDIVPNWFQQMPAPNIAVGLQCEPIKIEMVIRGYLSGHAWRTYRAGERELCGVPLPVGLRESDAFPEPIITPATKADEGHDEDISAEAILECGIVSEQEWAQLTQYTRALFERGTAMAAERGLILVDTKYEFGRGPNGEIMLMDEIHTPDSSRYFYREGYTERQDKGEPQKQLSKEFVRQWLIEHGFQGLEGQVMPDIPESFAQNTTERYLELYHRIVGDGWSPDYSQDVVVQAIEGLQKIGIHAQIA